MANSLVRSIQDMSAANELIMLKLNYPASPTSTNSSYPRVVLKKIDGSVSDVIVGTTDHGENIIINPDQIVTVQPYEHHEARITRI